MTMLLRRLASFAISLGFLATIPELQAGTVYWSGPGGDQWNTSSSPYTVDTVRPFGIQWAGYSRDGQFNRPSGIALADLGSADTSYVFGSTGYGGNRPYRSSATTGLSTSWTAQEGTNDSGTGLRIALSPDGTRIYHIDVANVIRAYDTARDPAGTPLWSVDADAVSPGLANLIKVGPDDRIYGHFTGTAALDPQNGERVWYTSGNPENAFMPGAFYGSGSDIIYIVSGRTSTISAYNIATPSPASAQWTYVDTEVGFAGPTIDPNTGEIYVFRTTRVIKLTPEGTLVWASSPVGTGESGKSYGTLSRDGATFYYQTGTNNNGGKLYAFNTRDGSIRWSYATQARAKEWFGGPVVSKNGVVVVANGAISPGDNRIFAIYDSATIEPTLLDTFDLNDAGDSGGPSAAIGHDGIVYVDAWAAPNATLLYAFHSQPTLPAPTEAKAIPYYSTAYLSWAPVEGAQVGGYLVYRKAAGQDYPAVPTKYVGPRTSFTDYGLEPGTTYYYKIGTHDVAGRPNGEFIEISTTLGTDPTLYSTHANLEMLMAIYRKGWTDEQVAEYVKGLELSLAFYLRNTGTKLNLDVTWYYIDAPLPTTDGNYGLIEGDLRTRGIQNDEYDLLYTIGPGQSPCLGGYTVFGSTKASLGIVCGVAYPGKDPDVNYTVAWTLTHEINHAIDGLVDLAGAEDMLYCHFPWNYPEPLDGTRHMDWGTHYDGIAAALDVYNDYFRLGPPYDGYIESVDLDGDGLPDKDSRFAMDEARFGSNPNMYDTDQDGLSDLEEFARYNFTGTDPTDKDTDGDGLLDSLDPNPLYAIPDVIHEALAAPVIDGKLEASWPLLAKDYYFTRNEADFGLKVYGTYDPDYLYFAVDSTQKLRFMISLDGSGADGRFESDVRHPDGTTDTYNDDTKDQQYGDSWADGYHLYADFDSNEVLVYSVGTVRDSKVASTMNGDHYLTEIRIPRVLPHGCAYTWYLPDAPVVDGLRLNPGQKIGLNITFSNFSGGSQAEFSGTWTSLFETHSFVDFTLDRACTAPTAEICDGIDNDCDGLVDEASDLEYFRQYPDSDGDGYGLAGSPGETLVDCALHEGYALEAGDCDDENPVVNPGAEEICDGIDNDCDGLVDAQDPDAQIFVCLDADGDGFGDPSTTMVVCEQEPGMVTLCDDCDDANPFVNPTEEEVCNDGLDNDCDGQIDNCGPACGGDAGARNMPPMGAGGVALAGLGLAMAMIGRRRRSHPKTV